MRYPWPRITGYVAARLAALGYVLAHEVAKGLLEKAVTPADRAEAIKQALALGMPLSQIEEYLDWLDARRAIQSNLESA